MKNKRSCITLALIAFGLLIAPFASALAEETPVHRYVFNIDPKKMPGIVMGFSDKLHEIHVEALIDNGDLDCTACHEDNDETIFMGRSVNNYDMEEQDRTNFVHRSCVHCHENMKRGPIITECRSCHNPKFSRLSDLERAMAQ